jgi:hypothetical protein
VGLSSSPPPWQLCGGNCEAHAKLIDSDGHDRISNSPIVNHMLLKTSLRTSR